MFNLKTLRCSGPWRRAPYPECDPYVAQMMELTLDSATAAQLLRPGVNVVGVTLRSRPAGLKSATVTVTDTEIELNYDSPFGPSPRL